VAARPAALALTQGPASQRWIRYEMPLMVRVDVDEHTGHAEVTRVVLALEHDDIQLPRA
jgi:hypothetical protein